MHRYSCICTYFDKVNMGSHFGDMGTHFVCVWHELAKLMVLVGYNAGWWPCFVFAFKFLVN